MTEGREREWRRVEYFISTDNERLDLAIIHDFISNRSYFEKAMQTDW